MHRTRVIFTVGAFLHLLSVAVFIWSPFPESLRGVFPAALRIYKNLSGTFRDYAFFAPRVASDLKAGFLLTDVSGGETFLDFAAQNSEVGFRYNCIIATCMRDANGRDLFAQSWAALVLGSHPSAKRVAVIVKTLDLPSMREYRAGKHSEWRTVYVGEFTRHESRASH
jgi:hypothetical protein